MTRELSWDGCVNVRDLGGLPLAGGGWTRRGGVVRGDAAQGLTARGWAALRGHGVVTIVDLQGGDAAARPGIRTLPFALDDPADAEFRRRWSGGLDCTPLYYPDFLASFPGRVARVVALIADAGPGAVLVHCGSGRDRTGLVVLVLLALAGVTPEAVADDYVASTAALDPVWGPAGLGDQTAKIAAIMAREDADPHASVVATARALDAETYLRDAGLRADQVTALRARLGA